MKCWNCAAELDLPAKIPFRALRDKCSFYQHCCKNCKYYKPGIRNDCMIPGTEPISDRTTMNYCEEFVYKTSNPTSSSDPTNMKNKFKNLFKDEDY